MWCKLIRGVEHCVYEPDEFGQKFPDVYVHTLWRGASPGDWVLSDDGNVVQILKKYKANRSIPDKYVKYYILRTCVADFYTNPGSFMDTDPSQHMHKGSFAKRKDLTDVPERKTCSPQEKSFVEYVFRGKTIFDAYNMAYDTQSTVYSKKRAKHLFACERIQKLMQDKVKSAAEKLGITEEYVLQQLKDIVTNEEGQVKLGALRELKDVLDMSPEKRLKVLPGRMNFKGAEIDSAEFELISNGAEEGAAKALEAGPSA